MKSKALERPVKTSPVAPQLSRSSRKFSNVNSRKCFALNLFTKSSLKLKKHSIKMDRFDCTLFFHIFFLNLGEFLLVGNLLFQFYRPSFELVLHRHISWQ